MDIKISLNGPSIDAKIEDLSIEPELFVFADTNDLMISCDRGEDMDHETIFSLFINCGKNKEKAIMFDVEIDEIEEFANAILKKVDIVRRNCSEQIKYQESRFNKV